MGAAFLAGVGAGMWKTADLAGRWRLERRFAPSPDSPSRAAGYAGWRRAVERSRGWVEPQPTL
jgi:glycerol kinase